MLNPFIGLLSIALLSAPEREVRNLEDKEIKNMLFEVFAAGFQACVNGESLAAAYEKFYKEIINHVC
jgi:hypothetical protein